MPADLSLAIALPTSSGEWLAFMVLLIALAGGLMTLFAPRTIMAWTGLAPAEGRDFGFSEIRGPLGGFYVGVSLYLLMATPRPYIVLTFGFGFACLGRITAFLLDRVRNREHVGAIIGDAILATIPLLHVTGGFSWLEVLLGF
ncbi:MAG: hypothetical protein AAF903_11490 [Pseudomonadota bacterium]